MDLFGSPFPHGTSQSDLAALISNFEQACSRGRSSLYWAFFKTVNTTRIGTAAAIEEVQCILCDQTPAKSSGRKHGVFSYNSLNGTSSLDRHTKKCHLDVREHLERELNRLGMLSSNSKRPQQTIEERWNHKTDDVEKYTEDKPKQQRYNEVCSLLVTKSLYPLSIVEDEVFRLLVTTLDPKIRQMSRKRLATTEIPRLDAKIQKTYIDPLTQSCVGGALQFDLWMSRQTKDIFSMIFTVISDRWKIHHINLGMIETQQTDGASLSLDIMSTLTSSGLENRVVALVKDQGANLARATTILQDQISNSVSRSLLLHADCFAHALNKVCKNAMACDAAIKEAMKEVKACILPTKKSPKVARMLSESQAHCGLPKRKLVTAVPTRFASYLACFDSFIANEVAIKHMFSNLGSDNMRQKLPSSFTWNLIKLISVMMKRVVATLFCSQGDMLISDVVAALIGLYTDFHDEELLLAESFESMKESHVDDEEGDLDLNELKRIASEIAKSVRCTLSEFLEPFSEFKEDKAHVYLSLLCDPRFKRMKVARDLEKKCPGLFSVRALNPKYEQVLFKCLINAYKFLHQRNDEPSDSVSNESSEVLNDEDDFSEYIENSVVGTDEFLVVRHEFLRYRETPVLGAKDNPLFWWKNNHHLYPTMAVVARQFLSIPSSQCECERSFSVAGILTQNRRSNLSVEKMDLLIKINKNLGNFEDFQAERVSNVDSLLKRECDLLESFETIVDDALDVDN